MYRVGREEIEEVTKVILSKNWFRVGDPAAGHLQETERFEKEWSELTGAKYSLIMSGGGTAAITCALAGIGIGPGDEVIVPAYTWLASATSVLAVGAIPVLADINESMTLDPEDFERRIGPNTKAVIPVHMAGRVCDMDAICRIAKKHGLKVIEDSCQADGGSYKGRRTGSIGDAGAFSLNQFKIISSGGEGGILCTSSREIFEKAFIFHDSGSCFRPIASELTEPIFVAQQYRASEVMSAIARVQLSRIDGILSDLRKNADAIVNAFKGVANAKFAPSNDARGDCGTAVVFQFENEAKARAFCTSPGIGGYVGIDHGKHVYVEWEPLLNRRIMHHPRMNPFNFEENKNLRMDYSKETCSKTLDILRRTVFVGISPDWTSQELESKIKACRDAISK